MEELFGTIAGLLKTLPEQHEFRRAMVFATWRRIGGGKVTENSLPIEFDNGHLTVAVTNETWRRQLGSLSKEFVYKLNQTLGWNTIRSIVYVVDGSSFTNFHKGRDEIPATITFSESAVDVPEISRQAAVIIDTELRQKFIAAATSSLAYKKRNGR